ncbi:MAG: transglycosylase SLT domain-containing protein, partial [Pseudolabrys sp.]
MAVHPATASAPQVTGAIRQAAQSTGISFEYLLTTAKIESNFNPTAQASTSSAKGLYQFIDQTWLGTMKQDGAALGLAGYADANCASARRSLRGFGSHDACRNPAPTQRSAGERHAGRSPHRQQRDAGQFEHQPPADQWRTP